MWILRISSRRALDQWIEAGKLKSAVRNGVEHVSGMAIDEARPTLSRASAIGAAGVDGLSPEEMSLLARPVPKGADSEPAPRTPSSQDLAERLPVVLEPYLTGLHEKIDGLSARVNDLTEAIDRRPEPEVVRAEVVPSDPAVEEGASREREPPSDSKTRRLFEALARGTDAETDPTTAPGASDSDYDSVRAIPPFVYVIAAVGLATLTALFLLWAILQI